MKRYDPIFKESSFLELTPAANDVFNGLDSELSKFNRKYKNVDYGSSSIPSAPNSRSFLSLRSGFIRIVNNEYIRFNSFSVFCHYVLHVGGLVDDKMKKKVIKEYYKVLENVLTKKGLDYKYDSPDFIVCKDIDLALRICERYGTNFSQYGCEVCNLKAKPYDRAGNVK